MLEQLRREQEEELEKVQHHLEAIEVALRELEENMRILQLASADTENVVVTEVGTLQKKKKFDQKFPESVFTSGFENVVHA